MIDLEGLAHHRGSAFGKRAESQPTQINFENQKWEAAIESFRKCIDVAENQFDDKKEKQKEKKKRVQDQARKWVTYTEGEEERVEALKLKRKALGV